jgi:hypothetical protein
MGLVFVAEQQQPVRRKVALKVIKPGMDSRQVIARFEAERQALAMMDHPNIAKVHDGGATMEGRPYFVMELVKGTPIHRVLRSAPPQQSPTLAIVPRRVPRGAARAPERDYPPRPQAVQYPGVALQFFGRRLNFSEGESLDLSHLVARYLGAVMGNIMHTE